MQANQLFAQARGFGVNAARGEIIGHALQNIIVAGVLDVVIDLAPGNITTVTVTSDAPLLLDDVRAAVDEAGYDLVT